MKIEPGYYAAYRTDGQGKHLRLLSQCFATEHPATTPEHCRQIAQDWADFEQRENPGKTVVLIQVFGPRLVPEPTPGAAK